jgi:hypothetical protein
MTVRLLIGTVIASSAMLSLGEAIVDESGPLGISWWALSVLLVLLVATSAAAVLVHRR